MNDERRMLECAAKAIGGKYSSGRNVCGYETGYLHIADDIEYWNPLTDDGDAFRLMTMIGIDECIDYVRGAIEACDIDPKGCREKTTRLAITLAAARLGGYEG